MTRYGKRHGSKGACYAYYIKAGIEANHVKASQIYGTSYNVAER